MTLTHNSILDGGLMDSSEIRSELESLHPSAFGWAMVCCGRDRDLASDVLQQTYCRILQGDASYKGKSKFSTWFFGVIRFVAKEEFRRRKRSPSSTQGNVSVESIEIVDSGLVSIEQFELAEQLNEALEKISQRQREVLHLTFYENMTIEQTAELLQISIGTARQHYQRGKANLSRILSAHRELER